MNEIVVNKIICDVINGKLKYEENSDAFSEIENKELTLYINYLLCDIYHKLGDSAQMIEIDDCFELNMCNKERYYLIKELIHNKEKNGKKLQNENEILRIRLSNVDIKEQCEGVNHKLIENAMLSRGRLDLYVKAYIVNCLKKSEKLSKLSTKLLELYLNKENSFDEGKVKEYVDLFTKEEMEEKWKEELNVVLPKMIDYYQKINDTQSLRNIEAILIKLLGHVNKDIRNRSTVLLNLIYDETTLQLNSPLDVNISTIGQEFNVSIEIEKLKCSKNLFLYVISPNSSEKIQEISFSFFKPTSIVEEGEITKINFELGQFKKCGYYDWSFFSIDENGIFSLIKDIKGRFIVQNSETKQLSIHEVFCDSLKSSKNKKTFDTLTEKIQTYHERGINALYIMGVLERDNQILYDNTTGEVIDIENSTASPMAVVDRSKISSLLGGDDSFSSLRNTTSKNKIKIFIDMLSRISSSRYHRKYKDLVLHYVNEKGKKQFFYGSEGNSVSFDDTMILNYRDIRAWELLISDTLKLCEKYKIDGVHIDNCQSWPQIMSIDIDEMLRVECDGSNRYTNEEILNGNIIIPNKECGYWNTDLFNKYPNPLLIKITKEIWLKYPTFIFIGECVNTIDKFSMRHFSLMKSGIIPRMYILPSLLCSSQIHNKSLDDKISISLFKKWYQTHLDNSSIKNCIVVNSSSGHCYPYPAMMYGRANWTSVDLLFTMNLIPMTFMDEIDGELVREKICNVYEYEEVKPKKNEESSNFKIKSKSVMKLNKEDKNASANATHRVNSFVKLSALQIIDNSHPQKEIFSGDFELKKIIAHYDNRRKIRRDHQSLQSGKMIFLNHKGSDKIISFARYLKDCDTSIIVLNCSSKVESIELDLNNLKQFFDFSNCNSICYIDDYVTNQKGQFYFLNEIFNDKHTITLRPFSSVIFGIALVPISIVNYSRVMAQSVSRMSKQIKSENSKDSTVDSFAIAQQLKFMLDYNLSLTEFAKWLNTVNTTLWKYNIKYSTFFQKLNFIKTSNYSTKYYSYINKLSKIPSEGFGKYTKLPLYVDLILKENKYGSICFVTPELGRWSTVGGLGVMVDELTTCLAKLGQDVIVITPYYHKNRKGVEGYLETDPAGFIFLNSFTVNIDRQYTFDVYHGKINEVKLYFIHNGEIFPEPYHEGDNENKLRQIVLMGKASLELLCNQKMIPSIIVTNDWYTGLTAGYGKGSHFGEAFKQTTFFHICHNLETAYQGRIYTNNTYNHIHQLDNNWLIDPYWKEKVINPSRCAILLSDQWGTVSKSYMEDLLNQSQLSPILRQHQKPFAYPNGIFKDKRIKIINDCFKGDREGAKEQIQKKFFHQKKINKNIPIFSFIGRLTAQKGVLLILQCAEELILKFKQKIQILIGGMANMKDPYCVECVNLINHLLQKYPENFWASPNEFFTDGTLINYGSDFGLMPSIFEPGGIVQHEFFIAGTPVLAFKTGGLKDSVFEYDYEEKKGNGVVFDVHEKKEFIECFTRAYNLYHSNDFEQLRKNAFNSAIDVMDVAIAWGREFYRLQGKTFFDGKKVAQDLEMFTKDSIQTFTKEISEFKESNYIFNSPNNKEENNSIDENKTPITFIYYSNNGIINNEVNICGSWDDWKSKRSLSFDPLNFRWTIVLMLNKGKYLFKYIVDGEWCINQNESSIKEGNIYNNFIVV